MDGAGWRRKSLEKRLLLVSQRQGPPQVQRSVQQAGQSGQAGNGKERAFNAAKVGCPRLRLPVCVLSLRHLPAHATRARKPCPEEQALDWCVQQVTG